MKRIAIIGAGSWGTALSIVAGRIGHQVYLWSRNERVVDEVNRLHVNSTYLKSRVIPDNVKATTELAEAIRGADRVLLAAPSHVTRELLMRMLAHLDPQMIFVSATKGIEIESGKRMSEVVDDVIGSAFEPRFVCLSGPSFAQEVVAGQPTAVPAPNSECFANRA